MLRSSTRTAPQSASGVHTAAVAALPRLEARHRAEGGPGDVATYPCSCGYVFVARVSTSVDCPHCGTGQAW